MRLSVSDRLLHALLRALKILAYVVSTILIFLVVAGILTQTPYMRNMLRTYLVSTLSKNLNGTLHIGRIEGNMIGGFTMDSVTIDRGEREVISIGRIVCFYEPLGFLRDRIDVSRLVIESPGLSLVKSPDGSWNLGTLFRPSGDTAAGTFNWEVRFADIQVHQGSLSVEDSQLVDGLEGAPVPLSFPSSYRFTIGDIWFEGAFSLKGGNAELTVNRLKWLSRNPDFELQQLAGTIRVEPSLTGVEDLTIQSRNSYLELDASISRSLLGGMPPLEGLRDDSVSLRLTSRNIDYDELSRFLTWIPRGRGAAAIRCDADGPFGDLRVSRLNVVTGRSSVDVRGTVSRLHTPEKLHLDVLIEPSRVTLTDLDLFIRQIPEDILSPDLPIGVKGHFVGLPLDFATDLELEGEFGRVSGRNALHLNITPPAYSASYEMEGFNPGLLFVKEFPRTLLNGRMELQGEDFDPEKMKTNFFLILDSSRFRGYWFDALQANGTMSSGTIDAEAGGSSGRTKADASFSARLAGDTISVNAADFSVASLDLAPLLQDSLYGSDITVRGKASFTASSVHDLNARAALVLLPSRFRGHDMEADSISFVLDQDNPRRKLLRLTSSMADVELDGMFDLDLLAETVERRFAGLVRAVGDHAAGHDTTAPPKAAARDASRHPAAGRTMNFSYRVNINNLLPVGEFLSTTPFNVHGSVAGNFSSDPKGLSAGMKGRLEEFYIGTIDDGWLMKDATVDIRIGNLGETAVLENLTADLDLDLGTGIVAGKSLDNAGLELHYADARGIIAASGRVDSILTVVLSGQASIQPRTFVFDLDTLRARAGDYGWSNDQDVQFRLSSEGLRIMRAVFRRGDEEISARGLLGKRGSLDAVFGIRRFDLSALNMLLPYRDLRSPGNGFMGTAQADISLGGTPETPTFSIQASSENFVLRKTRLGYVESNINYADRRLNIAVQNRMTKASARPVLTVDGRMPADFSFTGAAERFPDLEQDIRIHADNFDISIFDPLIPELQNLTGRLNSNLVIGGTPLHPAYSGSMEFGSVNCLFVPNNLPYVINGTIEARGSRLVLGDFTLENVPTARPAGKMQLSGAITTDRFKLDSFDITGRGSLLIMGEETRRALPEMYGPLFIRPDSAGLNLSGNLSRPFLSGNVLVTDAFITFPPKSRQQSTLGFRRLNYVVVNDTSAGYTSEADFLKPFFGTGDPAAADARTGGQEGGLAFIDQLRYNLNVETRGTPSIRFIFSQLSDEILYAELNGRASVVNETGEPRIYGTIEIGSPSYYKFYQRFDATGRLKFVGPWDNPELDVRATYEASHVSYIAQSGEEDPDPRRVQVLLEITGRRYQPVLKMTLREESTSGGNFVDISGNSTPAEAQSDAISFILTGKFSDELTSSDRSTIAGDITPGTGAMVGSILTSSLLTSVLEDYIRKEFPFIRSVDVTYEGGSSPGTNVQVSANALKGYLRVGGKILSDVGRASVSYKASLGDIFDATSIRNLFFEIEQRIETETQKNKNTVEGRIYYRFSF
ncbi:MAG TPA: translocation/assembly module TamB domain-containing protein [Bacteroidota bacterium]|nr:translocation/assembly module TamB domain-containing protein [Bacteroidota bacterium]